MKTTRATTTTPYQSQLKNFGLNPLDWLITPQSTNTYILTNQDCSEVFFIGKWCNENQAWISIELDPNFI